MFLILYVKIVVFLSVCWADRHPALFYPGAAVSVANTIYLAFLSFEAFMLETDLAARQADFHVPFLAPIIFFLSLYASRQPARGSSRRSGWIVSAIVFLSISIAALAFASALLWLLHMDFAGDPIREIEVIGPLLIEVASLAFIASRQRDRIIRRQFFIFLFWTASILAGFCAIGAYEQISDNLLGNPLKLAFCSTLFQFANFCYLVHAMMFDGPRRPAI